ncbi:MAG TPA: helix-turn-helix transcriptional regulator [Dehalococcoidia bacterium]|nr:helix-turn-helix transcriptional regulator [Dehalococcoidia bacterium]
MAEARQAKGLTLFDAERGTRIPRRYLEALEADQFSLLPAPVYARGFLRNYARFLGLDENALTAGLTLGETHPSVLPVIRQRRNTNLWAVAGVAFMLGLLLWAILVLRVSNVAEDIWSDITGGDDSPVATPIVVTATPAPSCGQLAGSASLSAEEQRFFDANCATPTPEPPTQAPFRTDCDAIRGTDYESSAEREFFLENCLTPAPG